MIDSRPVSCTPLRTLLGTGKILVGQFAGSFSQLIHTEFNCKQQLVNRSMTPSVTPILMLSVIFCTQKEFLNHNNTPAPIHNHIWVLVSPGYHYTILLAPVFFERRIPRSSSEHSRLYTALRPIGSESATSSAINTEPFASSSIASIFY